MGGAGAAISAPGSDCHRDSLHTCCDAACAGWRKSTTRPLRCWLRIKESAVRPTGPAWRTMRFTTAFVPRSPRQLQERSNSWRFKRLQHCNGVGHPSERPASDRLPARKARTISGSCPCRNAFSGAFHIGIGMEERWLSRTTCRIGASSE